MVLLGTVILPHGTMTFDGNPNSESQACQNRHKKLDPHMRENLSALYQGMCDVGKTVADLKPDLVILNSPHGLCLSDAFGVYINDNITGNAQWNDEWSEFCVSAKVDVGRSQELKAFFESSGIPVQGIRSYSGLECKLRWGEVVPMWYLHKHATTEPKYIMLTNDTKPKTSEVEEWRLNAGRKLAEFVEKLPERVVVVISGDLAHYHPTDCTNPLYLPDPSYDKQVNKEAAEAYEAAITSWVENHSNSGKSTTHWDPDSSFEYLKEAAKQDPNAGVCGNKGFVLLHGLLAQEVANGAVIMPKVVVHRSPTYYGMMAATFLKG